MGTCGEILTYDGERWFVCRHKDGEEHDHSPIDFNPEKPFPYLERITNGSIRKIRFEEYGIYDAN